MFTPEHHQHTVKIDGCWNYDADQAKEALHYFYIHPLLKLERKESIWKFYIHIESRYETIREFSIPYRLTTCSVFYLDGFEKGDEQYDLLENCIQFAYKQHVQVLKKELEFNVYFDRIREGMEPGYNQKQLESILYFAFRNAGD